MVDCRRVGVFVAALAFVLAASGVEQARADVSKAEAKCAIKLAKGAIKLASTVGKEIAKCRNDDISGKVLGLCPTVANQNKIDAMVAKVVNSASKTCKSVCSVTKTQECIADALCPPLSTGGDEQCSAGAKSVLFDMHNLGFPGPYCEGILGHTITTAADIGDCVAAVAQLGENSLLSAVYGSLDNASGVSSGAAKCLSGIGKMSLKLTSTVAKMVSKCRNKILQGKELGDPARCAVDNAKAVAKIAKMETKLRGAIGKCSDSDILELDLCGGGVTTVADAKTCVVQAAREAGDSTDVPALRQFATSSIIDAAYPSGPVCGDNVVNQIAGPLLLLGEECDGTDDAACPGNCLPPGDLFECTCGNIPRVRLFASHLLTDADAGWSGGSHEQGVSDKSGFVTELSNCDCSAMTGAGCTGSSTDSVCDVFGATGPVCSWDAIGSGTRCDDNATKTPAQGGTKDGVDKDKDCAICDEFSANPGDYCVKSTDCQAQCYDANGLVTGPCTPQGSKMVCGAGEVCRGRCDKTPTCVKIPNGAPLPVSSNGAFVCSVQVFRTNITGTRDIVTGAHEVTYRLYAIEQTGENATRPCPVCGGFCRGGKRDLLICEGRCDGSGTRCRFDSECPTGETCASNSPDCPGGFCELGLICGSDQTNPVFGQPCRIEYEHPLFGTMSNDCLPNSNQNITGLGFEVDYLPGGTSMQTLSAAVDGVPCTATGFSLYDCPCAPQKPGQGAGHPTKPNLCAMACDAGANFGQGCATGDPQNELGDGTRCTGGSNAGKLCDEDTDCPGSSCSVNPMQCEGGDPSYDGFPCAGNADCGPDTCVDACPGGRCVPLCVPDVNEVLVPGLDGVCAAGPPIRHCDGANFEFLLCTKDALNGGCKAVCTQDPLTSCTTQDDCPSAVCNGGSCEFPVIACTTNADCPTDVVGLGCDTGSGTCIMPVGQACATNADCPACYGSCDHARACEAGGDNIIGTSDDFIGAGICISDNKNNCFLDPIVAVGQTTADSGFDPAVDDIHGVIWCYGSTQSAAINSSAGFGGPGRVIQHGVNVTNGFTSLP